MRGRNTIRTIAGALAALVLATPAASSAQKLTGAGATFPNPVYSKWFDAFNKKTGIQINYQSIGSGGGIQQYTRRTVDFGATDGPMTQDQMNAAQGDVIHIPTVLGADVITWNLPALGATQLKFDGPILADIFLGKITKWNDARLTAMNPGVKLPAADIVVVHRSDGSGTTYIFTDYLSKVSPEWKAKVGFATAVNWPTGLAAKGNEGVTQQVRQVEGTIAYVEQIYAVSNKLPLGLIKNAAGNFVAPTLAAVTSAAGSAKLKTNTDFRVSITNAPGADSYPIASFTWLLVRPKMADAAKGKALRDFLTWMITPEAQQMAQTLLYAPLPPEVVTLVSARIKTLK